MSDISNIFAGAEESIRDKKNRIIISSEFRKKISFSEVLVRKGRAYDYPILELIFFKNEIRTRTPEERVNTYASGRLCYIKSAGRITIPERFFKYLEERKELKNVIQSGAGDQIYIWNAEDFKEVEARLIKERHTKQ